MKILERGRVSGAPGDRFHIDVYLGRWSDPPREEISFAIETLQPETAKPRHFHRLSEELYFVLSGTGFVTVNDEKLRLEAGAAVLIEIGDRHFLETGPGEELVVAIVNRPAFTPEDYIRC
jgi:mannose-6-phosphate isomerase-like protein (cupin superfamily)